jgi:prefoldin subunit 5
MLELERITARRNELDALAEELAKQLAEVHAEREELVIASAAVPAVCRRRSTREAPIRTCIAIQ